ncbi:MAG: type I methionyl aminopeptidase [Actinobacteria bacterium RBG_16_64_13]|nr:MAG: type I methionyl aminopeptidase [Actinobacteria bacterium RBG_16_64_13]
MIIRKSQAEIEKMARAGAVVWGCLDLLGRKIEPGITTKELDRLAEKYIRDKGGVPTFKGYRGFPGSICASPNDMVVHGIPGKVRLREGDVLGVDVGVTMDGYIADGATTFPVGEISAKAHELLRVTEESLSKGIAQCRIGNRVGDISHAVQTHAEAHGFSVVESMVGHGVGREMHEDPQVPNFGPAGQGPELREGMVLAIEPMVNFGGFEVEMGDDSWAIYTKDGGLSAHFEHTVAITKHGPRILTTAEVAGG